MIGNIINKTVFMAQSFANFVVALPLLIKITAIITIVLIVLIITLSVVKKRKMKHIQEEKLREMAILDKAISNDRKEELI